MECPICTTSIADSESHCKYCGAELNQGYNLISETSHKKESNRYHKATFGRRFLANFIDLALLLGALGPSIHHFGESSQLTITGASLFLLILLFLFQLAFLTHDHQTIGKKAMGLAIVCNRTGDAPRLSTLLLMRHILPWMLYCIPFIAPFILLVNGAFFFLTGDRGLHDILSNTEVVRA